MLDCVDSSTSKMNEHLGTAHMVPIVALCTLGIVSFRASYPTKNVAAAFSNKLLQHLVIFLKIVILGTAVQWNIVLKFQFFGT